MGPVIQGAAPLRPPPGIWSALLLLLRAGCCCCRAGVAAAAAAGGRLLLQIVPTGRGFRGRWEQEGRPDEVLHPQGAHRKREAGSAGGARAADNGASTSTGPTHKHTTPKGGEGKGVPPPSRGARHRAGKGDRHARHHTNKTVLEPHPEAEIRGRPGREARPPRGLRGDTDDHPPSRGVPPPFFPYLSFLWGPVPPVPRGLCAPAADPATEASVGLDCAQDHHGEAQGRQLPQVHAPSCWVGPGGGTQRLLPDPSAEGSSSTPAGRAHTHTQRGKVNGNPPPFGVCWSQAGL